MATKGKGKRPRKATDDTQQESPQPEQQPQAASGTTPAEPPPASQPPTSDAQSQSATASSEMVKKGVYLSALIYVEGYQKPPDDFNTTTVTALNKVLSDCLASPPDGLTMKLKSVDVQNDVEQDDEGASDKHGQEAPPQSAKKSKQEEKFQF